MTITPTFLQLLQQPKKPTVVSPVKVATPVKQVVTVTTPLKDVLRGGPQAQLSYFKAKMGQAQTAQSAAEINKQLAAGVKIGGASAEYGQTIATLALLPVAATAIVPAVTAIGAGLGAGGVTTAATAAGAISIKQGVILGGAAAAGGLAALLFGGQKLSQQQQAQTGPQTAAPQTTDQIQRQQGGMSYDFSSKTTSQDVYNEILNTQTAGGDINAAPGISTTQYAAQPSTYNPVTGAQQSVNLQDLLSALGQEQAATQKQDQTGLIIIAAIVALGAFMFLKKG